MGKRLREIECCKCGHIWIVDLDKLDEKDLIGYKDDRTKRYRVRCPRDHTYNVIEVPNDEQDT